MKLLKREAVGYWLLALDSWPIATSYELREQDWGISWIGASLPLFTKYECANS